MELVHRLFDSELLFPKKKGAELERAAQAVARVYGHGYKGDPAARSAADAIAAAKGAGAFKLLHLTCHPFPRDLPRLLLCMTLALAWMVLYPVGLKLRCFVCSLAYSFSESAFTFFERGRCYTSLAQFLGNLVYIPVLLDLYGSCLGFSPVAYILLFPLNIWVLEIVLGHLIIIIWGYNVAWNYDDYADAFFNGCIRIGHGAWWLGLGAVCYIIYPLLEALTSVV